MVHLYLPAFTCLGHESQDLLSPCDGSAQTRPRFILSSESLILTLVLCWLPRQASEVTGQCEDWLARCQYIGVWGDRSI